MKKTAIALAAMIAASSSALAADFTVYGKVDVGVGYNNVNTKNDPTKSTFSLDSGNNSSSRFGFKGTEDLGNGYAVAFQLENSFSADDGKLTQEGRLFGREARLSLVTPYGTFSGGRMGMLGSSAGTYGILAGVDSMGGGWSGAVATGVLIDRGRADNMFTYASPEAAGFQGFLQYSFGTDAVKNPEKTADQDPIYNDNVSNGRDTKRYMAAGLTYANGPVGATVIVDKVLAKHAGSDPADAQAVTLGVNYDFEVAKVYFGAQFAENENVKFVSEADGYTVHLGTAVPLPCGDFGAAVYYGDFEDDDGAKNKAFNVALTHTYPFSKRTYSYLGLGYKKIWADGANGAQIGKETTFTGLLGLVHSF